MSIGRDIVLGIRGLRREPAPLAIVVACLALGIASTTTLYGLVDGLILRDVTTRHADRLVRVGSLSWPNYRDLAESGVFERVAAGGQCGPLRWRHQEQTRAIVGNCLSPDFFEVVGGQAAIGRVFGADDAAPERDPHLVLLSDRFWRRLGRDPNVIGSTLTLNDVPFTVLGVLPPDYRAVQGYGISPDVFVPHVRAVQPQLLERNAPLRDRVSVVGVLHVGTTIEQTRQALAVALGELHRRFPDSIAAPGPTPPALEPVVGLAKYGDDDFDQFFLRGSRAMTVVVLLVLVTACANAAGLLLARGVSRAPELRVHLALGAPRGRIVRQLLSEAIVLAGISTLCGFALTWAAGQILATVEIPVQDAMLQLVFIRDWRLFFAASGIGAACAIACGLLPALASSRPELGSLTGRTITPKLAARSWLIAGQLTVSVVVLCVALIFARNLRVAVHQPPGFDVAHTAWFDLVIDRRLPAEERTALRDRLFRAVSADPTVESVSWAWYLPYQVAYAEPMLRAADGDAAPMRAIEQGIGPGYLATAGIPILDGREFMAADLEPRAPGSPTPVIVNDVLARRLFPGRRAVGERIVREAAGAGSAAPVLLVIGVARGTPFRLAGEDPPPLLHSLAPYTPSFVVRTRGTAAAGIAAVSRSLERQAPGSVGGAFPFAERHANATFIARGAAVVLGVLAGVGLIIALVGLCGLVIASVVRRTREAAIRMALGASRPDIIRLMLVEHLRLVAIGCLAGGALVWLLAPAISRFLVAGVTARDPAVIAVVWSGLAGGSALAIWLFSRRMANTAPASALRAE